MYDAPTGGGVVEAVALAGGALPKAALTKTIVKRADGTAVVVDLFKVMVQGDLQGNIGLKPGDIVMVPESKAKVAVMGAVRNPGYYDIEEGTAPTAADAIALAGGTDKGARIAETSLMRMENGKARRITVRLDRILKQGKAAEDVAVQNGDVIYVPKARVDWQSVISSLGVLGWLWK